MTAKPDTLSIGGLAKLVGIPTSTIRFYDRRRLLRPDARTEGNYRVYGTEAVERLRFIRSALANGFTLNDIEALLGFRDGRTPACPSVQEIISDRLDELEIRAREIQTIRTLLQKWLRRCRQSARTGRCQVIERLGYDALSRAGGVVHRMTPPKKSKKIRQH